MYEAPTGQHSPGGQGTLQTMFNSCCSQGQLRSTCWLAPGDIQNGGGPWCSGKSQDQAGVPGCGPTSAWPAMGALCIICVGLLCKTRRWLIDPEGLSDLKHSNLWKCTSQWLWKRSIVSLRNEFWRVKTLCRCNKDVLVLVTPLNQLCAFSSYR